MKKLNQKKFYVSLCWMVFFVLWTLAVKLVDVQAIGPKNTSVGFSAINGFIHSITHVHMNLYTITDWLGLVPIGFMVGFAILGVVQCIKRKSILKVDYSLFVLGGFYIVLTVFYFLFENIVINYRPILIAGCLEASYPSSTTLLVLSVMPTALMQLNNRIKNKVFRTAAAFAIIAFIAFMVIGRLISGVHWFTDIIGGITLSKALVELYSALASVTDSSLNALAKAKYSADVK